MTTSLLLVYIALLIAVTRMAPRIVANPVVQRLRVLFPSWRFFDVPGDVPQLSVRWGRDPAQLGTWRPVASRPRRRPQMLAYNPSGNLALAHATLLHALVDAVETACVDESRSPHLDGAEQLARSVPYRLTSRLAREHVLRSAPEASGLRFQFRLVLAADGGTGEHHELLLSEVEAC